MENKEETINRIIKFSSKVNNLSGISELKYLVIWIFDEPYAGMDDNGVELIDTVLKEHISRGGIVILASHKHTKIEKIQTQIINMKAS